MDDVREQRPDYGTDPALRQRLIKAQQAIDTGLPVGQLGIAVDKPGQRALHLTKSANHHHQATQCQGA